jgi:hypothetical protein
VANTSLRQSDHADSDSAWTKPQQANAQHTIMRFKT